MTTRSVAVTGATGFIGRHLVAHFVAAGVDVRAVVRPESVRALPRGVTIVRAPLVANRLGDAFAGVDAVVHLAGVTRATRAEVYEKVNVHGTRAVADAARASGARLIHISSLAAVGSASPVAPRREEDPPAPITPYGASKLAGERVVTATPGLRWTILRPAAVYGPADSALLPLFRLAERGVLPLIGRPGAAYTFVYVADVVRAVDAAIGRASDSQTIFVGHPRLVTARTLLEQIRAAAARPALIVPLPLVVGRAAALLCDLVGGLTGRPLPLNRWRFAELAAEGFVCRVDRMREQLGVEAGVDLPEGLAETAAWYRREGWLPPALTTAPPL